MRLHFRRKHGRESYEHDFALSVLDSEARMEADHCFNIYDGKKALLVAAANQEEKIQWMEDIAEAAQVNVNLFQRTNTFVRIK